MISGLTFVQNSSLNLISKIIFSKKLKIFAMMYYGMILHNFKTTRKEEEEQEEYNPDDKCDFNFQRNNIQ